MSLMAMQNMPSKDRGYLESPCRLCADLCNRDIDQIFSNDNKCLVDLIEKYLSIKVVHLINPINPYCVLREMIINNMRIYILDCYGRHLANSSL